MKKQIIILLFLIFSVAATTFAQPYATSATTAPKPISVSLTDPLQPVAGRPYDYSAAISPVSGTAFWYATNSTSFTSGGTRAATIIPADNAKIFSNATGYNTSTATTASPTATTVTWTSAGLAGINATTSPLFMVVEYGTSCSNNLKVMQIIPRNAFTVDITNMKHDDQSSLTYGTTDAQCFANVQSASFSGGKVVMDYGTNVIYFEVIAANFTDSYKPTLKLSGLDALQTATIEWGITKSTYNQTLLTDEAPTRGVITSSQFTVNTQATNTSLGVSIYVKVTIKNHGFEGTSDEPITLAVEAVDSSTPANADVQPDLTPSGTPFEDTAVQTLNLRPTVTTTPVSLVQ